jgi:hypothetical protein
MELTQEAVSNIYGEIMRQRANPLNKLMLISPWHMGMMDVTLEYQGRNRRRIKREQNKFNKAYRKKHPPVVGGIDRNPSPFWQPNA